MHVRAHRAPDLLAPRCLRVDRHSQRLHQNLVIGRQQFDEALLFTGEVVVEGALGGAGVADDIGHGRLAVSALGDRGGQAVE